MFLKNNSNRKFINFIILIFIISTFFIAVSAVVAKTINILSSDDIANFRSKIGIGISNPNRNLHIYDISANAEIDIQSGGVEGDHWAIFNNALSNSLHFWKGGAGNILNLFSASGNIGIGLTNPGQKVDVNGSINALDYYAAGSRGLSGFYNIIPTNYSIVGGLWTAVSGVTGATRVVNIRVFYGGQEINCVLNFQNGLLISSTCPNGP